MFKLVETSEGSKKSHLFNEDTLLIGDGLTSSVHLSFPGRGLKPEHLRIEKKGSDFFVINLANDPFVSINGLPFYKKKLTFGDILKIKQIELTLGDDLTPPAPVVQQVEPAAKPIDPDLELQRELKKLEELTPVPLERPLELEEEPEQEIVTVPIKKVKNEPKAKRSLKDVDYLTEKSPFERDKRPFSFPTPKKPFRYLRYFSIFFGIFIITTLIVGLESYLRASEESSHEELMTAESLSDIAMAFTYAQLNHISPQKHNWSDPEFIQNNLLATLPYGSASSLKLDAHGVFGNTAYLLRVYTSNDLSRFLLVAHPAPSWIQWLIPKNSIIVDSTTMELRKINDLKTLNRILANLNTLDGVNAGQISELVKKGDLIPLSQLAKGVRKPDFAPPKAVQFLRPGAENLIYNAPRYHYFSDQLIKKVSHFALLETSSHELQMLKSELEILKKLPNLILYTTDGIESATRTLKGLKEIQPDANYLLAYLKYDTKGTIRSSQIIMDKEVPKVEEEVNAIAKPVSVSITPDAPNVQLNYGSIPAEEVAMADIPLQTLLEPPPKLKTPLEHAITSIYKEQKARIDTAKASVEKALKQYLDSGKKSDQKKYESALKAFEKEKQEAERKAKLELLSLLYEFDNLSFEDLNIAIENEGFTFLLESPKPKIAVPLYKTPADNPYSVNDWFLKQLEHK